VSKTAESVSPMHPDKICDRISDAILDACLKQDPDSRVAIETMGGHGIITITGELTTEAYVDMREIAKTIVGDKYGVQVNVVQQSPEIANGVDTGGAGDQGIMIGYACNETPEKLPLEVVLARNLNRFLYKTWPYDGKTQVTVTDDGHIASVVASFQNAPHEELRAAVLEWLNEESKKGVNVEGVNLHINPAGDWNIGGFEADTGLTGRKLAVDNYGPSIPLGGGCFSGKDASKVDRSAAYMARRIACDYLKERNAKEVFVRLAYAIGYDQPVEATVIVDGKSESVNDVVYDLSPNGIIKFLDLKRPVFGVTAEYGHFGNGFEWDK
jgi:S-adenosylmethionine synthetase